MRTSFRSLVVLAVALTAAAGAGPAAASELVYVGSDRVRAGIDRAHGTLAYLAGPNGVDLISEVVPSFYGGPSGAGWHPVGLGGEVIALHEEGGSALRTLVRPLNLAGMLPCECLIETTYRAEGGALRVRHELRNARSDRFPYPAQGQELPALYSTGQAHRLFTYDGDRPWTGGALREVTTPWPLFTGGGPTWLATERWAALVDGAGYGVGIFSPAAMRFIGIPGRADRTTGPNGYLAPSDFAILDHDIVYAYEYALVVGTLADIRGFAYANRPADESPDWDFTADREGWWYGNAVDGGWPIAEVLRVRLEQPDPYLWSPERVFQAREVPKLYIRAAFHHVAAGQRGELFFNRAGEGFWPLGENRVDVPLNADGLFHTYEVDLSRNPGYAGLISRLRYDPVFDGRLGSWMELDYVSHRQRQRSRQVSFRLVGHLRAVGRVTVDDVSPDCRARTFVYVERRVWNRRSWRVVAVGQTRTTGEFRVPLRDLPGRYRVRVPETRPGERCLAAVSPPLVHGHRR